MKRFLILFQSGLKPRRRYQRKTISNALQAQHCSIKVFLGSAKFFRRFVPIYIEGEKKHVVQKRMAIRRDKTFRVAALISGTGSIFRHLFFIMGYFCTGITLRYFFPATAKMATKISSRPSQIASQFFSRRCLKPLKQNGIQGLLGLLPFINRKQKLKKRKKMVWTKTTKPR